MKIIRLSRNSLFAHNALYEYNPCIILDAFITQSNSLLRLIIRDPKILG